MNRFSGLIPYLKGFAGAIVGVLVVLLIWTAYVDHERTTAMWIYTNQQIAAKQAPK